LKSSSREEPEHSLVRVPRIRPGLARAAVGMSLDVDSVNLEHSEKGTEETGETSP
jgi:hypothetical protein